MKPKLLLFLVCAAPVFAQPPVAVETTVTETVSPGKRVVEETIVETPVPGAAGAFNPRRQLGVIPRAVPADEVIPAPGTKVETTETVTKVNGRVYNTERNVVIVEGRELPYTTVPVLFVKETAELLDSESRAALDQTASAIQDILVSDPAAKFDVEGHTSVEGTDDFNLSLSAARAKRIYDELTQRYRIPASALSAHGYGESYAQYPNGPEAQWTLDRRVLVVRVK